MVYDDYQSLPYLYPESDGHCGLIGRYSAVRFNKQTSVWTTKVSDKIRSEEEGGLTITRPFPNFCTH